MVRCNANPVVDVPITFRERIAGESKLQKQNLYYVQQLMALYWSKYALLILMIALLFYILYSCTIC